MKILAAVDGSPFTKRMLAYIAAHDEWLGTHHEYTLLTIVAGVPPRAAAAVNKDTLQEYYEAEGEKVFKPIRTFFTKQGVKASYVAKVGHAAEVIAATADKGKFDLVIMGSHGHGSFTNLVMGSTATKVLSKCSVPVLLVR
jgi:nucleotide-binding universal stress UspA family protein